MRLINGFQTVELIQCDSTYAVFCELEQFVNQQVN
jgi:hypothetical protein